jgi:hypothetical protein
MEDDDRREALRALVKERADSAAKWVEAVDAETNAYRLAYESAWREANPRKKKVPSFAKMKLALGERLDAITAEFQARADVLVKERSLVKKSLDDRIFESASALTPRPGETRAKLDWIYGRYCQSDDRFYAETEALIRTRAAEKLGVRTEVEADGKSGSLITVFALVEDEVIDIAILKARPLSFEEVMRLCGERAANPGVLYPGLPYEVIHKCLMRQY